MQEDIPKNEPSLGPETRTDVQLLKEWNIDGFFARNDDKRHSTHDGPSAGNKASPLERQVHKDILAPRATTTSRKTGQTTAQEKPVVNESHFMKNFSFIKNFKREKSDLFPLSKRHSSEISYNVNPTKHIGAVQRNSAWESGIELKSGRGAVDSNQRGGGRLATVETATQNSVLRAGPRREKTESVILRRNSSQVASALAAKQIHDQRLRPGNNLAVASQNVKNSNNGQIDIKSIVAGGDGGSRILADQVIFICLVTGDSVVYLCPCHINGAVEQDLQ